MRLHCYLRLVSPSGVRSTKLLSYLMLICVRVDVMSATLSEADRVGLRFGCMSATLSESDRVGLFKYNE